jgi:hypothetical protein
MPNPSSSYYGSSEDWMAAMFGVDPNDFGGWGYTTPMYEDPWHGIVDLSDPNTYMGQNFGGFVSNYPTASDPGSLPYNTTNFIQMPVTPTFSMDVTAPAPKDPTPPPVSYPTEPIGGHVPTGPTFTVDVTDPGLPPEVPAMPDISRPVEIPPLQPYIEPYSPMPINYTIGGQTDQLLNSVNGGRQAYSGVPTFSVDVNDIGNPPQVPAGTPQQPVVIPPLQPYPDYPAPPEIPGSIPNVPVVIPPLAPPPSNPSSGGGGKSSGNGMMPFPMDSGQQPPPISWPYTNGAQPTKSLFELPEMLQALVPMLQDFKKGGKQNGR